jgi:hypothetical protein
MKYGNYSKINEYGYVPENTFLQNRDVIISKVIPIKENKNDPTKKIKYEDQSKIFKTKAELYGTLPKQPATDWPQGTYRQWLERGYHVIKGQKGQFKMWEFNANEYETDTDGKTSTWGRAYAVYFDNNQVEANTPKEK